MVLHILHYAYDLVRPMKNANAEELTNVFLEECKTALAKISSTLFIIDVDMVSCAMEFTDYMTKNKLLFFGYQLDPLDGIFTCYEKILEDGKSKLNNTIIIKDEDVWIFIDSYKYNGSK